MFRLFVNTMYVSININPKTRASLSIIGCLDIIYIINILLS